LNRTFNLTSRFGTRKLDGKLRAEKPNEQTINGWSLKKAQKASGTKKRKPAATIHLALPPALAAPHS
jgi:hypothetical protein